MEQAVLNELMKINEQIGGIKNDIKWLKDSIDKRFEEQDKKINEQIVEQCSIVLENSIDRRKDCHSDALRELEKHMNEIFKLDNEKV